MKLSLLSNKTIHFFFFGFVLSIFFISPDVSFAANKYWVGDAGANTSVNGNWSLTSGGDGGTVVPNSSDVAIFDGGKNTNATIDQNFSPGEILIDSGYTSTITEADGVIVDISGDFTLSGGTFFLNGSVLIVGGTLQNNGTIRLIGNEIFNNTDYDSGTIEYVGDGDSASDTYYINTIIPYYNLEINATDASDIFYLVSLPLDLFSYWSFDDAGSGTAIDRVMRNNGTVIGATATTGVKDVADTAYSFDVGDYIDITNFESGYPLSSSISYSVWFKTTSSKISSGYGGDSALPILGDNLAVDESFGITGGVVSFFSYCHLCGGWQNLIGTTAVNDGAWHHLVITQSKSESVGDVHIYLDSALEKNETINMDNNPGYISNIGHGYQEYFDGSIDQVRIYNRALTPEEIATIYNHDGAKVTSATSSLSLPGDLIFSSGIFNATSTDLILNGIDQTISLGATTTFVSLTKVLGVGSTTPETLFFSSSSIAPLVITGTTTMSGLSNNFLRLRSVATDTPWYFSPDGGRDFQYLDVEDSYNNSSTTIAIADPAEFVDSGNNTGWDFTDPTVAVSKFGTQVATTTIPTEAIQDLGGAFTFLSTDGDATINSIKLKQIGSLTTDTFGDIELSYKEVEGGQCSTTTPPDATSFGTAGDFDENNIATTAGTISLAEATTTCLYVSYNLTGEYSTSTLGRSIDFEITNPSTDIEVTGGTVSTTGKVNITGLTVVATSGISSMLSLNMDDPAKNPTVFYLQDNAVWKMVAGGTPIRLTNPNFQVQALTFTDMTGANSAGVVRIEITMSNMDNGDTGTFMNVTRTLKTTASVRAWGGVE